MRLDGIKLSSPPTTSNGYLSPIYKAEREPGIRSNSLSNNLLGLCKNQVPSLPGHITGERAFQAGKRLALHILHTQNVNLNGNSDDHLSQRGHIHSHLLPHL